MKTQNDFDALLLALLRSSISGLKIAILLTKDGPFMNTDGDHFSGGLMVFKDILEALRLSRSVAIYAPDKNKASVTRKLGR